MKLVINSTTLYDAISTVTKVQSGKNVLPILDCVLFQVKDGMLSLMCSDTELFLIANVPLVEYDMNFRVAIPSKDLMTIKSIANQPITIECVSIDENDWTKGMSCTLKYENGQYDWHVMDGEEFPLPYMPEESERQEKTIPLAYMLDGINHTKFAALNETDTIKPQMAGVYFDMQPYGMITVASDGYKLAKVWYKDVKTENPFNIVIINKAAKALSTILKKVEGVEEVDLIYSKQNFCLNMGAYTLYGRLPELPYPNYNMVIPIEFNSSAVVSKNDILGAFSRVGQFADATNEITLVLGKDMLDIIGKDSFASRSAKERVGCEYEGQVIGIAVDYHYLTEVLNTMTEEDTVRFNIVDEKRPIIITPAEQDENRDLLYLVMPRVTTGTV